jgi:NADPH2:quinone reductase
MKAIQVREFGGPEVLELVELPDPEPSGGETLVRVTRAGVNFADTHQRRNQYIAKAELPYIPGKEVAGVTPDGRRVAGLLEIGGYAEMAAVPADAVVSVPDGVSDDQAAAVLIQGLTAQSILAISARLAPGESVVVHAAAGGTGTLAVQLAKRMGAGRVIAVASTEPKRKLALQLGADAAVDSSSPELTQDLIAANDGNRVDVVLEASGGAAFDASLEALAPFGRVVVYGIASRRQNTIPTGALLRSSRAVIGFWMTHLLRRPDLVASGAKELFAAIEAGQLNVVIGGVYPLADASRAHTDLQSRSTQGKLLLDTATA